MYNYSIASISHSIEFYVRGSTDHENLIEILIFFEELYTIELSLKKPLCV